MRGIKNKESGKWKKVGVFVILFIMLVVLLNSARNVYEKKKEADQTLVRMEKEAKDLKDRETYLKESLNKLSTKEGVEFELRQKLNVAQVGESVAIIVDENASSSTQTSSVSAWQKFKSFWSDLFR